MMSGKSFDYISIERRSMTGKIKRVIEWIIKNREKIWTVLIFSGLILYPVFLIVWYAIFNSIAKISGEDGLTAWGHLTVWGLALMTCIITLAKNTIDLLFHHKRCFSALTEYITEERYSPERAKAMFPIIPKEYLYDKPVGIVLGTVRQFGLKKYICINPHDPDKANHILINGNSKAGKSSGPVITSILNDFSNRRPDTAVPDKTSWVVIDTKPELADICTHGDSDVMVLNPADLASVGWDLYAGLEESSSDDEVANVIISIIEILIPEDKKNAFFVDSARSLLEGTLFYEFRVNHLNFVRSIQKILYEDLDSYITEIKEDEKTPQKALALLSEYGKKKNEKGEYEMDVSNATQDIKKQVKQKMEIFTRQDVFHFLDTEENPDMCDPSVVDRGISIFLSIKRSDLKYYNVIFLIIVSQILERLSRREDYDQELPPCVMMLDEFHNLGGKIPDYAENLGYIRSKKVILVTIIQQYSALVKLYGREDAEMIVDASIDVILSLENNDLGRRLSAKAGEFDEMRTSYQKHGTVFSTPSGQETVSYQRSQVIRVMDDFSSLLPRQETIAFIDGRYFRFNKVRYFKISWMRDKAEANKRYNNMIIAEREAAL